MVRDYLTEDIDRIFIDNQELFEVTRDVIQKYSRRSRNWIQLYGGDEPILIFDIEKQIESAYRRKVWLKSGAYLIFDEISPRCDRCKYRSTQRLKRKKSRFCR